MSQPAHHHFFHVNADGSVQRWVVDSVTGERREPSAEELQEVPAVIPEPSGES